MNFTTCNDKSQMCIQMSRGKLLKFDEQAVQFVITAGLNSHVI